MRSIVVEAGVLLLLAASPPRATAQTGDQSFVESLRREDPATAERYVSLRDARARAAEEFQRAEAQYRAAGPALRTLVLPQVRQAQRKYAESSLALIEFLDGHDREALARYQSEIGRINGLLEERARTRADLQKLLRE